MTEEQFILVSTFCEKYQVEPSFVQSLSEYGLIEMNNINESDFISLDRIHDVEKFIHLHYDLDINVEGIDAISHLLARLKVLQDEIASLKNKLRMYE